MRYLKKTQNLDPKLVREFLTTGAVIVDYVRSDNNLVDPLTKGLTREKVFKS